MRKLKDLVGKESEILLNDIVLYMPKKLFNIAKDTGLNTQRVIFSSAFSSPGGFWVKVEPEHAKKMGWDKNRVFPISMIPATTVLEWRILKILKK